MIPKLFNKEVVDDECFAIAFSNGFFISKSSIKYFPLLMLFPDLIHA